MAVLVSGKDRATWLAEISAKDIYSDWYPVFERLYPGKLYDNLNSGGEQPGPFHDGLLVYTLVLEQKVYATKLPKTTFDAELATYKQELTDAINAQFDSLEAQQDMSNRLDAINDWQIASENIAQYQGYTNKELWKKAIIDASDTAAIASLEAEHLTLVTEENFKYSVADRVRDINFGLEVIGTMSQLNVEKSITEAQVLTIMSDASMQTIISLLQTGSLVTARTQIAALNISGLPPMTEGDRTKILGMIDARLS